MTDGAEPHRSGVQVRPCRWVGRPGKPLPRQANL